MKPNEIPISIRRLIRAVRTLLIEVFLLIDVFLFLALDSTEPEQNKSIKVRFFARYFFLFKVELIESFVKEMIFLSVEFTRKEKRFRKTNKNI